MTQRVSSIRAFPLNASNQGNGEEQPQSARSSRTIPWKQWWGIASRSTLSVPNGITATKRTKSTARFDHSFGKEGSGGSPVDQHATRGEGSPPRRREWYRYQISPEQFEGIETVSGSLGTIAGSPSRELHSRGPLDADPVASIARLMIPCRRWPARPPTASSKL